MDEPEVTLSKPAAAVAEVRLNRPQVRNAQNVALVRALDDALSATMQDDDVKVVIISGEGPAFSSGHDLADPNVMAEPSTARSGWSGWLAPGAEGRLTREYELYFEMCRRWRDLPKPLIAQVQGRCIGAGLMVAWICDLIVASDDALFSDPVAEIGSNGVEWFAHPWEIGPRRAKEFLMTSDSWTAEQGLAWGMVNHVVPSGELASFTLELACRIAQKSSMTLKLVKLSVNRTLEAQGQHMALNEAFALHQLAHSHCMLRYGVPIDPSGVPESIRRRNPRWQVMPPAQ